MISVLVTFRYGNDFSEAKLAKIAEGARGKFEGMPGLRSKVFTIRPELREACNFYVWESEAAAKAFFTPETVERVAALYGVRPAVEFAPVAAIVENRPG